MRAERVKHIWDPTTGEFVPLVAGPAERLRRQAVRVYDTAKKTTAIQRILFVGLMLRLWQLGKGAFWYDEGVSVVLARLPWSSMIDATAGDVHPPLYYALLWLVSQTGIPLTEFTARLPSLLLSVLVIYLTWRIIQLPQTGLSRMGQFAVMAWVVISPLQLHYAQEARMYSLLQAEVLTGILLLWGELNKPTVLRVEGWLTDSVILYPYWFIQKNKRRIGLSVVMALMLYTHNYSLFYIMTFAVVAWLIDIKPFNDLMRWSPNGYNRYNKYNYPVNHWGNLVISIREFATRWLPWFVVPAVAWLPWFVVLLGQMGTVAGGYWIQPVRIPSIIFVLYQMLFAYSMPPAFQGLGVLMTCGILLYTAWKLYQAKPRHWAEWGALSFGPLLLSVIASLIWNPVLLFRGLIGTAIPLTILVVKAIEEIRVPYKRVYAYALIGVTLVAGAVGHYQNNAINKGITTTWVHTVVDQLEHGDAILALNDNGVIAMKTYAPDVPVYKLKNCGADALGSLSPQTRKAIGVQERTIDQLIPGNAGPWEALQVYNRIFFVSTVAPISPQCEIDQANTIIEGDNVRQIIELANTEYTQAGVYIINTTGDVY